MAEEQGNGFLGSGPTGSVGAVTLPGTLDPIQVQMATDRDVWANYWKNQDNAETKKQNAIQNIKDMTADVNSAGALPEHQPEIEAAKDAAVKYYADNIAGQDPRNPDYKDHIMNYNLLINHAKSITQQSVGQAQEFTKAGAEVAAHPDSWDAENLNQTMATSRTMGDIGKSTQYLKDHPLLQPAIPDIDLLIDKTIKAQFPNQKPSITLDKEEGGNMNVAHLTYENIPYEKLAGFSAQLASSPAALAANDKAWNIFKKANPGATEELMKPYQIAGQGGDRAEVNAKADFLHSKVLQHYLKTQQDLPKGLTYQGQINKAATYANAKQETKATDYTPEAMAVADLFNGRPGAENAFKTKELNPIQKTVTLITPTGPKQQNVTLPNTIESIVPSPNGGIDVVTTAQKLEQAKNVLTLNNDGTMTPTLAAGQQIKPEHFDSIRDFILYSQGKKGSDPNYVSGIDAAFRRIGALTSDGDYDPEKMSPSTGWKKRIAQQSQPAQQNTIAKPIVSDGTDANKWTTDNTYKVGEKTYFYKDGKWQKQ